MARAAGDGSQEERGGAVDARAASTDAVETEQSGLSAAAKAVAEDISTLVRAEIDMAKAEVSQGVKAKTTGIGLVLAAAVLAWLAVQGLLIAAGLALALVLPGWAAALVVAGALLLLGIILALVARPKLRAQVGVSEAKRQAQADVDYTKSRLQAPRTKQQVQEDITWTKSHLSRR